MKTSFRLALAGAALLAAAFPVAALAQGARPAGGTSPKPAATALPHKVGLIDMSHVFTNYEKLKVMREQLQAQFETDSAPLKEMDKQLKAIAEELKPGTSTITKGSEQWTAKEQEFTNLKAQMQAEASNLQREFIRKEVAMYKEVHAEVSDYVAKYAEAYKYTLILRYAREPEGTEAADDPNQVMNRINQLVVYHQAGDDITDVLLAKLNELYAKSGGQRAASAAAAPASARPTQR